MRIKAGLFYVMMLLLVPDVLHSEEFAVFDGQSYNGKYYPRMDIIEWGSPSHMEFHVYSKKDPIDMAFQLDETKKNKVMMVNYVITSRDEHLCRRVLAPGHFFGQNFYVYKDNSDPDFDNTIVSMDKLPDKPGQVLVSSPAKYASCEADAPARMPAAKADAGGPGLERGLAPPPTDQKKFQTDHGAIKGKGSAVPFSDL